MRWQPVFRLFLSCCLGWAVIGWVDASEPSPAVELLSGPSLLRFEVQGTSELAAHPLAKRLKSWATTTTFFEPAWNNPRARTADDILRAFETRLGLDRQQLLLQLTAGGLSGVVTPTEPPQVTIITRAADADLPRRLLDVVDELAGASGVAGTLQPRDFRGFACRTLGGVQLALQGNRLLLSGDRESLERVLDSLPDEKPGASQPGSADKFRARVTVDLQVVRNTPDGGEGLEFPESDPGAVAFFGGWTDLLRRYHRGELDLSIDHARLALTLRVSETSDGKLITPGLEGFWGPSAESPAPLLRPAGMLYSASWLRDYASLWQARNTTLTPEIAAKVSQGDIDAGQQMQVVGATFTPSELLSQLGPHFRVVLLEGAAPYAEVAPPNIFPAGVAVIELRDEALVRNWSGPVLRILNLILNGDQGIVSTTESHGDATLTILSLPTTPQALRRGALDRFNFRTTYTFAAGHFVIGTSPAAVRGVLDQLRAPASLPQPTDGFTPVERQLLAAERAGDLLDSLREAIRRGFVLNLGLNTNEAQQEFERLRRLLTDLGTLEAEAGWISTGFEYRINWQLPRTEGANDSVFHLPARTPMSSR